jgi:hypothetical protein
LDARINGVPVAVAAVTAEVPPVTAAPFAAEVPAVAPPVIANP